MAQPYFNTLEELVARELSGIPGLFCKHFFGGAALYLNAKICASLTPAGFAFKLGEERCSVLIASGKALPLRYFEKSPQKKGYVLFPAASKLGRAAAARYLNESLAHARSIGGLPDTQLPKGSEHTAASKPKIGKTDRRVRAFVGEVTAKLLEGKCHQTPGFGTFSTCTRKASADRIACKMAMFRASTELRVHVAGGPQPLVTGPHAEVVSVIVEAMQSEQGVNVPLLGRMAVVPVPGRNPKLIFHGSDELNGALMHC